MYLIQRYWAADLQLTPDLRLAADKKHTQLQDRLRSVRVLVVGLFYGAIVSNHLGFAEISEPHGTLSPRAGTVQRRCREGPVVAFVRVRPAAFPGKSLVRFQ